MDKFISTLIDGAPDILASDRNAQIVKYIQRLATDWSMARVEREEVWTEAWGVYLGTPQSQEALRSRMLRHTGDINNDWRHKVNIGKAFENVETVVSYLMSATFPNRDWFDCTPRADGNAAPIAPAVKKLAQKKFKDGHFISAYEMHLRQTTIIGQSVIALPWRYETAKIKKRVKVEVPDFSGDTVEFRVKTVEKTIANHPEFEVLDMFDVLLKPNAIDANDSPLIRKMTKTRAEIAKNVQDGYYNLTREEVINLRGSDIFDSGDAHKEEIQAFQGMTNVEVNWDEEIEIWEYWGDVHLSDRTDYDIVATVIGNSLVRYQTNPYWCGKPFVVCSFIPLVRSVTALGLIEPSLGLLHELSVVTNQRLDNLELSVDSMWTMVDDGVTQPEDIYTAPGRVIKVAAPGNIQPVQMPKNFTISYQEAEVLESRIDKINGTGPMVGAGSGRSGERVTATEIQATKDAGGNRLSGIHKHIEETCLYLVLSKVFRLIQQFTTDDETVKLPHPEAPGSSLYVNVGPEELEYDFLLYPVGADYVADRDYELNKLMQFLQLSAQYEDMKKHVDYYAALVRVARLMGLDDIEQLIIKDTNTPPVPEMPQDPLSVPQQPQEEGLMDVAGRMGGVPMQTAIQGQLQADGGAGMLQDNFGIDPANIPMSPDMMGGQL